MFKYVVLIVVGFSIQISAADFTCTEKDSTPDKVAHGKTVFETNCAVCHGVKGMGDGAGAAALNPKPRNFVTGAFKNGSSVDKIFDSVTKGLGGAMASFKGTLSNEDRCAAAIYVNSLVGKK